MNRKKAFSHLVKILFGFFLFFYFWQIIGNFFDELPVKFNKVLCFIMATGSSANS
jgi:hypothetical protein